MPHLTPILVVLVGILTQATGTYGYGDAVLGIYYGDDDKDSASATTLPGTGASGSINDQTLGALESGAWDSQAAASTVEPSPSPPPAALPPASPPPMTFPPPPSPPPPRDLAAAAGRLGDSPDIGGSSGGGSGDGASGSEESARGISEPDTGAATSGAGVGAIIAGSVAAGLAVAVAVAAAVVYRKRRMLQQDRVARSSALDGSDYSNTTTLTIGPEV